MHPVLFQWRGVRIHSYTLFLYLGMVCGLTTSNAFANAAGLDSGRALVAMLLLLIVGLIGARALHVFTHWDHYRRFPGDIRRRSSGGASQLGGLWLMLGVSVPLLSILDLAWLRFWDVAVIALLVGLVFAKIGCLLHGCCRGRPSQARCALAHHDVHDGPVKRLPSQLLESGLALIIVLFAAAFWDRATSPGMIFLLCAAAYAGGRLPLQQTREVQERVAGVNLQSALSVALVLLALAVWLTTTTARMH